MTTGGATEALAGNHQKTGAMLVVGMHVEYTYECARSPLTPSLGPERSV